MQETLTNILQNPYFNILMPIITIASLLIGIYSIKASKKYKFLEHYSETTKLFYLEDRDNSDLHLYYKNREIPNLAITNVAIWNAGDKAIKDDDMAEPVAFCFDNKETIDNKNEENINSILDARIIGVTQTANCIELSHKNGHLCKACFKYLNTGDGFVVQIVHTGSPFSLRIKTNVIDEKRKASVLKQHFRRDHRIRSDYSEGSWKTVKRLCYISCAMMALLLVFWIIMSIAFPDKLGGDPNKIAFMNFFLVAMLFVSIGLLKIINVVNSNSYLPDTLRNMMSKHMQ